MKFRTVSGSEYEIKDGFVRRSNPSYEKRADGKWLRLINSHVQVGEPAYLVVESLRGYGGDDYGTPDDQADDVTTRTTSTVTEVYDD